MSTSKPSPIPASAVHFNLGDHMISALSDGYFEMPFEHVLTSATDAMIAEARNAGRRNGPPRVNINAFLIRQAGHAPILVDAGMGPGYFPAAGTLLASLAIADVSPEDIGFVLLTHLHADHCRGLTSADGLALFPNAEILVSEIDAAFWLDAEHTEQSEIENAKIVQKALAPYATKIKRFTDSDVLPGIKAIPLPGHSPGHTGYLVGHEQQSLLIWGDVVNIVTVQSVFPSVGFISDADGALAVRTRIELFETVSASGQLVAGMHTEFPGIGHVAKDGDNYRIVPADWVQYQ